VTTLTFRSHSDQSSSATVHYRSVAVLRRRAPDTDSTRCVMTGTVFRHGAASMHHLQLRSYVQLLRRPPPVVAPSPTTKGVGAC